MLGKCSLCAALGRAKCVCVEDTEQRRARSLAEREAARLYREAGVLVDPWLLEGGK